MTHEPRTTNDPTRFYVTKLRAFVFHVIDHEGYFVSNVPFETRGEAANYAAELTAAAKSGTLDQV